MDWEADHVGNNSSPKQEGLQNADNGSTADAQGVLLHTLSNLPSRRDCPLHVISVELVED